MTTCPTCDGKRTITVTVPNMQGPSNNRYQSSRVPFVDRNYQCHDCHGTGTVDCVHCEGTGYAPVSDAHGEYDSLEWCTCDIGDIAREEDQRQRDYDAMVEGAEYAAWQRELANTPVPAGVVDDLDSKPF